MTLQEIVLESASNDLQALFAEWSQLNSDPSKQELTVLQLSFRIKDLTEKLAYTKSKIDAVRSASK